MFESSMPLTCHPTCPFNYTNIISIQIYSRIMLFAIDTDIVRDDTMNNKTVNSLNIIHHITLSRYNFTFSLLLI